MGKIKAIVHLASKTVPYIRFPIAARVFFFPLGRFALKASVEMCLYARCVVYNASPDRQKLHKTELGNRNGAAVRETMRQTSTVRAPAKLQETTSGEVSCGIGEACLIIPPALFSPRSAKC